MTALPFMQLDAFTTTPCAGNPVAVFLDEDQALSAERMQHIASWTNLSETTFMSRIEGGYALRIFTPSSELPFAGHPTLGSAHAALAWGLVSPGHFIQRCGRGDIPIEGSLAQGLWIDVAAPIAREDITIDADALRSIIGSDARDIELLDVGPRWIIGLIDSIEELYAIDPDPQVLARFEARHPPTSGTTLYALDRDGTPHTRSFAPLHGIREDPVCGSGNLCVGEHMRRRGLKSTGDSWAAHQGRALGRDGRVHVVLTDSGARYGKHATITLRGEATL